MEKEDNRGVAEGEDRYFNGTMGLHVGIHLQGLVLIIRIWIIWYCLEFEFSVSDLIRYCHRHSHFFSGLAQRISF